jgi:hypothetical protein
MDVLIIWHVRKQLKHTYVHIYSMCTKAVVFVHHGLTILMPQEKRRIIAKNISTAFGGMGVCFAAR